ncbi:hypothetical protein TUMEXPCC7403_07055 [Tumidithrix helvetica PCC 7403]|uniref:eCIS core domain-containing protein n=1 Tax=Tumidithrix helvetica TaxID=3457545 RepID=UPI003C928DB1
MSEYVSKPAAQSSFVPPAVQIQTRPFAPPQVQQSAAPQNAESSQAERDLENQDKRSAQENLYFTDLSFSGNDDRGSSESVMQRKWEGIVQRYKEGGNTAPDPNHGYTPVRGSSQSIMQRKLDEMRQRVKEGGNAVPDPNYEYTPVRGSSQSIMQRKHQEMVQRYRENQAKTIQAKLAIGAVGDKYEQEADRVAAEVVQKINAPESVQREEVLEEDEEIQMKPLSDTTQPMEAELPQTDRQSENIAFAPSPQVVAPISPTINAPDSVQREVEEEEGEEEIEEDGKLQMKPLSASIQRFESPEDNEPLQMKSLSDVIQREEMPEEEEEIQAKSLVQRRDTLAGGEASADLESSIQSARGSGQSLDPNLQAKMGEAMGADFSGVKVHTDAQSDQLNQSIQARAFTTGQDVFFRQGAYDPSSRGGQELIAHELTHVVQQNGGAVQRSPQQPELQQHPEDVTPAVTSIQRKAYIGDGYAIPDKPTEEGRKLLEDEQVRRFKDSDEFEKFAKDGRVEGIGKLSDGTWVRLPETTLVLGEDHGDPKSPEIIQATNIEKKFRYEGFTRHSDDRLKNSEDLRDNVNASKKKAIKNKTGKDISDDDLGDEPSHDAEHALPVYARSIADVIALVKGQKKGEDVKGMKVSAGTELEGGYSLFKALLSRMRAALIYCKSYGNKSLSMHLLKQFYNNNSKAVDDAILRLSMDDKVTMPDFEKLGITAELMETLATAFETAAKQKLKLTTKYDLDQFKESLDRRAEPSVAITDRAKEDDYLRDASMLEMIKEAKASGDRLFTIGDAHRIKLQGHIQGLGLEAKLDTKFIQEQVKKDIEALMTKEKDKNTGAEIETVIIPTEAQIATIVNDIASTLKLYPGRKDNPKPRQEHAFSQSLTDGEIANKLKKFGISFKVAEVKDGELQGEFQPGQKMPKIRSTGRLGEIKIAFLRGEQEVKKITLQF